MIRSRIAPFAFVLAVLLSPATVQAGGVLALLDAAFTAPDWVPSWEIGGAAAADNGPASGSIQEHMYGKIVKLEATLANDVAVAIDAFKIQMGSTSDVIAVRNGDYLEWYLGTTRLECDSQRWTEGLPSEFFAAMIGSDGIKVMQANISTYVQVRSITIELDGDDLGCP